MSQPWLEERRVAAAVLEETVTNRLPAVGAREVVPPAFATLLPPFVHASAAEELLAARRDDDANRIDGRC